MTRASRNTAFIVAVAVSASIILSTSPAVAAEPSDVTVAEFADTLEHAASTDPGAAESAEAFEALSSAEQRTVVEIVNDPAYAQEFLEFALEPGQPASASTEVSELYPEEVRYATEVDAGSPLVGARVSSGFALGRPVLYPANSTQTLRGSSTSVILGVTITRLNIWVTFKTGAQGIPKKVLSSGSSATNFNFAIVVDNRDLTPYVSRGLAVARTVWTGSVLVKGATFRIDKLDTLKAFNGGLYSHTLVNQ